VWGLCPRTMFHRLYRLPIDGIIQGCKINCGNAIGMERCWRLPRSSI
jgi:hypothetical protein